MLKQRDFYQASKTLLVDDPYFDSGSEDGPQDTKALLSASSSMAHPPSRSANSSMEDYARPTYGTAT